MDSDYGGYAKEVRSSEEGGWEQLWREDRIAALLDQHDEGVLFFSGCVANQGDFVRVPRRRSTREPRSARWRTHSSGSPPPSSHGSRPESRTRWVISRS